MAELVGSIPSNILGEIIVDYVNRLVLSCKRCWAFLRSVMEYLVLVFNVFFRRAEVVAREDFVNKGVQSACRQVDGRGSVLVEILMTYMIISKV